MANIQRIRVTVTGITGLPGVSTFYAAEADTTAVAALSTFYSAVKNFHPGGTAFDIPGTGDILDETNGHIVGIWTQSGGSTQTSSSGTAAYASGVGARVRWATGGIVHFRRVTGTTFLVPLLAAHYSNQGAILAASLTSLSTAAATLVSSADLRVWSRPVTAEQATPEVPERLGSSFVVLASFVPNMVTSLRSRRV